MITWHTRFRKAIPDPPAARRKVVAVLGGKARLGAGELDALAALARDEDVAVTLAEPQRTAACSSRSCGSACPAGRPSPC